MPKLETDKPVICLIAGSFRPPNHWQWEMIEHFSELVGPDNEVWVIVSNPQSEKSKYYTGEGKELTAQDSVAILEIFRDAAEAWNVTIVDSEEPSPIRAAYGIATDPEVVSDCALLIGTFKDPIDQDKWNSLRMRMEEMNPDVELLDYRHYSYPRSYSNASSRFGLSSYQRRDSGVTLTNEEDALPKFLSKEDREKIMKIVGKPSDEESEEDRGDEHFDSDRERNMN